MIKAFKVFKHGVTNDWVTILIPKNEYSLEVVNKKISFYTSLGYLTKKINP